MHGFDPHALLERVERTRSEDWFPAAALIGGSALAGFGFARRGVVGATLTALGGALALYGVMASQAPASQRDRRERGDELPLGTSVQDDADFRSWESFPASDPPGTY